MMTLDTTDLLLRVLVAAALGGLVGLERELSDQPAGFRTHVLVSLGAALFTLVGAFGVSGLVGGSSTTIDPTRVASQVVTGIGFLGAGAIIRQGLTVRGLTTAATLWVTAAIGTAAALGFWTGAVATTVVTVVALYGLKRLERMFLQRVKRGRFEVLVFALPQLHFSELVRRIEDNAGRMDSMKMDTDPQGHRRLELILQLPSRTAPERLVESLSGIEGVLNVEWSR